MKKLYSAVVSGPHTITVFDVEKGTKSYSINLGNNSIINGPVITQDKLTIVVQSATGDQRGRVYSLKSGVLYYSFLIK